MILVPRLFSILQIQRTCIVFQVFTRHPLRRFFFNGSGVISPSCRDFSWCCLTLFWLNGQCPGCSPYASAVAKAIAKRPKSAAGRDQVWLRYLVGGDRLFCRGQSGEGGLSRGDCPRRDKATRVHAVGGKKGGNAYLNSRGFLNIALSILSCVATLLIHGSPYSSLVLSNTVLWLARLLLESKSWRCVWKPVLSGDPSLTLGNQTKFQWCGYTSLTLRLRRSVSRHSQVEYSRAPAVPLQWSYRGRWHGGPELLRTLWLWQHRWYPGFGQRGSPHWHWLVSVVTST